MQIPVSGCSTMQKSDTNHMQIPSRSPVARCAAELPSAALWSHFAYFAVLLLLRSTWFPAVGELGRQESLIQDR